MEQFATDGDGGVAVEDGFGFQRRQLRQRLPHLAHAAGVARHRIGQFGGIGGQQGADFGNVDGNVVAGVAEGGDKLEGKVAAVEGETAVKQQIWRR